MFSTLFRSRFHVLLLTLLLLATASLPAAAADAPASTPPATVRYEAFGRVVEVIDATTMRVNRGRAEGLTREVRVLRIFPMRENDQGQRVLGYPVLLAFARLASLEEHSAVLKLSMVTSPVRKGDVLGYRFVVTEAQRDDPLFELALKDVVFRHLDDETLFYELGDILGVPPEAWRARVLDAMVAEIRAQAQRARFTERVEGGRFHGQSLQEALAATGPEDVLAFSDYVRAFPAKYVCTTWKLVETYATWVVSGTPSGQRLTAERRAQPLMDQGDTAAEEGRFAEAEDAYRRALALLPDDKPLRERLESIINVRVWSALLEKDPDDTATRWKRMDVYFDRGAYAATLRDLERLEAAGYNPQRVARYRGYVACKQQRFDEALGIFKKLLAHGPNESISRWMISCEQQKRLKARPGSVSALLALAELNETEGNWDSAQSRYLTVLDVSKKKAELDKARTGQERVALLSQLDTLETWARDDIENHMIPDVRKWVSQLLEVADRIGRPGLAEARLKRLAEVANEDYEDELAWELWREQIRRAPRDVAARQALAASLISSTDSKAVATAAVELDAAEALAPEEHYTHQLRARLHLREGRLAEARASTERALEDKEYAWPRLMRARLSAAEGRYEEALRWAKEGHSLLPEDSDMRIALQATVRAEEAARAIAEGRDVARNRLRLVRSLVDLELGERARIEVDALKGTPHHEDASWAIASSRSRLVPLSLKVAAANAVRAETPYRARVLTAVRARLALEERPEDAGARMALARALVVLGEFNESLAVLGPLLSGDVKELAARDVAELARRGNRAAQLVEVSRQAQSREDSKTAEAYLAQAYELFNAVGDMRHAFFMAGPRAQFLSGQGRHAEALRFLRPVIEAARADGDPRLLYDLELGAARIESSIGSLDSMGQVLARGQLLCEALDDEVCLVEVHRDLGQLASGGGRLAAARQHQERAFQLAQRTGHQGLLRETLGTLSDLARLMFEPKQSRELAEDMLLRSRKALDTRNERYALMILGALAMAQGDAGEARARFEEAYRLGQRTGDTWTRAEARLWDGAAALLAARDPRAALSSYEQAVVLYGNLEDSLNQAQALMGVGEARAALGDLPRAREALVSVIELARERKRWVMMGHAQSELALLEVQRGQSEAALAAAGEAVRIADATDIPEERWLAYYAQARALAAGGKQAEASAHYERAVTELGRVIGGASGEADRERLLSYGRRRQVFQDAIELYLRLGKTERALELLQLSHDTRLRQMFDSTGLKHQDGPLQEKLQQLEEAESRTRAAHRQLSEEYSKPPELRSDARIQALSKVVASTREEMQQQLLDLKADHRQLYNLLAINPQSISEVRGALPEGTLVVVYFIASDALYAFLLTRDQERTQVVKVSVPPSQVDEAVLAYHTALAEESDEVEALAERLHGWLIAPIEAEMARAKTTLVVPFGSLYYLPFHALSVPDASGRPVYVLERHRLGYLSSTTFFKLMSPQRQVRERTLLGFANPDGSLVRAREELERITSESFPNARVLYGQEATRERFLELAGGYDILHFATHGVLSRDPRLSHLKMAREPLTVRDINGVKGLAGKTGLVVLSACETAIEHGNDAGDEFISLASAFGTAGSPAIVASLWQVNDKVTSELMAAFYAQLRKAPQVDTLDALRQAQ
ncbi:CHAT domain-containing protein, partial [Archangium sp.]|uniref:CHAT domain-containing protein n=1 Tax=Archangium sp. TaxID=1872627 RepID=UPI002ED963BE